MLQNILKKNLVEEKSEVIVKSAVINTHGYFGLNSVEIGKLSQDGKTVEGSPYLLSADLLAISGG